MAGLAGEALWLSFLGATLVALLTGLSYAELATAFPTAGAEYVYMRHAFPRLRWTPFATGTGALSALGLLLQFDRVVSVVGAAAIIVVIGLYAVWHRFGERPR